MNDKAKYKFISLYEGILLNKKEKINISNFRRSIHRIEKGLISKDLKNIFAEDYIYKTVLQYYENNKYNIIDKKTLIWGESILDEYFDVCEHNDIIKKSYCIYNKAKNKSRKTHKLTPYKEHQRPKNTINYDEFLNLALRRRSARFFKDIKVEKEFILQAMEIARFSPSACNRQSFKFLFYNDKEIVGRISNIPGGISGYKIPGLIVIVGRNRGYFDERDMNAPVIDSSLTAMTFLFALEILGLSSVCINWPCNLEIDQKIRKIINLELDEFIVMLIGVGWPDSEGMIPYSAKKTSDDLIEFNSRLFELDIQ